MSKLLSLSESIAREAHTGQLYGEEDYVEAHIIPVVGLIAKLGFGEEYQAAGWLHDTPEDSTISEEDLIIRGVPEPVVAAVDLLHYRGELKDLYLGKIVTNQLATVAKFADSSINLTNTIQGTDTIKAEKFIHRITKYTSNLAFLYPHLPKL